MGTKEREMKTQTETTKVTDVRGGNTRGASGINKGKRGGGWGKNLDN